MSSRKPTGIPYSRKVTHRFSTNVATIALNSATNGGTTAINMVANALENVMSTGTTGNAMLFDQMAKIYDKYVVTKCSVRVDAFNELANDGVIVGLSLKDDQAVLAATGHYAELGDTVYKTLTPGEHSMLTMSVSPPKFFGSKAPTSDSRLVVTNGTTPEQVSMAGDGADSRPSDPLYYHMWIAPMDSTNATAGNVQLFVTAEYEVTWMEPRELERSIAS